MLTLPSDVQWRLLNSEFNDDVKHFNKADIEVFLAIQISIRLTRNPQISDSWEDLRRFFGLHVCLKQKPVSAVDRVGT